MLSIISGANNLPEKIENIAKTLYKMGNGQDLMNFQGAVVDKVKYPSNPTVFRAVVLDSHS